MKLKIFAIIALVSIVIISILFISYNYLYLSIEYPSSYIFIGKTINTSVLYHPDQFTWYEYKIIGKYSNNSRKVIDRYEWDHQIHNANNTPHQRITHIKYNDNGYNITQINDFYWDITGSNITDIQLRSYENNVLKNTTYNIDGSYPYVKEIIGLPYGFNIAPKGGEKIVVGNVSYDCKKYYLPPQNMNGAGSVPTMFWFNNSVPVPIKIYLVNENMTLELVGWG